MGTINKRIAAKKQQCGGDVERVDEQPLETNVGTWPNLITVDLITLTGKSSATATTTDDLMRQLHKDQYNSDRHTKVVALSDGTQVIFARLSQLTVTQSN